MSVDVIKQELLSKLKQEHCFWSYNEDSIKDIPDDMLIEKTLLHLDLEEINQLFLVYPFKKIKQELLSKLKQEHCFWSYNEDSIKDIPDDMLIEKTLLHLDLEEINQLFLVYPFKKIKQVWLDYLIPQEEYLYTLNRFFAWYYFKAKKPDAYIKSMATRRLNKILL